MTQSTTHRAGDRPAVTVLLPAYEVERFVDEAIESVRSQDFTDWEMVAVDDGSRDETWSRLERWAARDERIRAFLNPVNLGMTQNWNRCLSEARGAYVIKLDADDAFRAGTLEPLVRALEADPRTVGAGVRTLVCNEELEPVGGFLGDFALVEAGMSPYEDSLRPCSEWFLVSARGAQLWHSSGVLFRRDWLQAQGGWDERFGCAADTEILFRLLLEDGRFAHHAKIGVYYRKRPGSVSDVFQMNGWRRWEGVLTNLLALSRYARKQPMPAPLGRRYVQLWMDWRGFEASAEFSRVLPVPMRTRFESVSREVAAPAAGDRLKWTLRRSLAQLAS